MKKYSGDSSDYVDVERTKNSLTSRYWSWIVRESGERILDVIIRDLPDFCKDSWLANPDYGGIYVNGHFTDTNIPIAPPVKIEYYQPKISQSKLKKELGTFEADKHILYEDEFILCVFKPASLHSMPAKEQKLYSLHKCLEEYCNTSIHMPSRLDYSTAGVLLVSKNESSHGKLQQIYEHRKAKKEYLLKVSKEPDWEEIEIDFGIERDERHPVLRKAVKSGGSSAITKFKKLRNNLILAYPKTGRTHQIRVHAASMGIPIVGDKFYGDTDFEQLCLLSKSIEVEHPVSKKTLFIDTPKELLSNWAKEI